MFYVVTKTVFDVKKRIVPINFENTVSACSTIEDAEAYFKVHNQVIMDNFFEDAELFGIAEVSTYITEEMFWNDVEIGSAIREFCVRLRTV